MALAESGKAIGATSSLIVERLTLATGLHVQASRPDSASTSANPRLNVFLYESVFDPNLRNTPLDQGQPVPLWMVLRYLLTPYDDQGESDTVKAHDILGEACRALQENAFLQLRDSDPDSIRKPLMDNPQQLKLTFVETTSELLSRVMQGTDEHYRFSIAFEVRPVMIAMGTPPAYNLLVGVDYTQSPPAAIGLQGVQTAVIPSLGPAITELSPSRFEVGETVTIHGDDLHLSGLSVRLGPVELPVIAQHPNWLKFLVRPDMVHGDVISAGAHPVAVAQALPAGRTRRSNALLGELLPVLASASVITRTIIPPPPIAMAHGVFELQGGLLGTSQDDTYVALYRDGETVAMFDDLILPPVPPAATQSVRRFTIPPAHAVPAGSYVVLVRVNGVQARNGPTIDLVP